MESTIIDLLRLNDYSDVTLGPANNKSIYVSCIKINGKPILPPLINEEKRKELLKLKERAIELERILTNHKIKSTNCLSSEASSIKTLSPSRQSTPTRPASLNLKKNCQEKVYALSKSKTEGSLQKYSSVSSLYSSTLSSRKNSKNLEKLFKSTLEQRLAAEVNVPIKNELNIYQQQSPILEEQCLDNSIDGGESGQSGRWSPLRVEQINSLRVGLLTHKESQVTDDNLQMSQEETTPDTVTQSPNLMRQNSYTLLTPSPALLNFIESKRKEEKSEAEERKRWESVEKVQENSSENVRNLNGDGSSDEMDITSLKKYSSSYDDFSAVENKIEKMYNSELSRDKSGGNDSGSASPDSEYYNSRKSFSKPSKFKYKGKGKKRLFKTMPSPKQKNDQEVPFENKENTPMTTPGSSIDVPLEVKTDLSELSTLLLKMKVHHERQKRELEEKQKSEMRRLQIIFQKKEAELLGMVDRVPSRKSRKSIYSESLVESTATTEPNARLMGDGCHNQSRSNNQKRPSTQDVPLGICNRGRRRSHSAKDSDHHHSHVMDDDDSNRRTRSMDYNDASQDTEFDFSFQDDFIQSKDSFGGHREYFVESDSISNFSSRSSTVSSENKADAIPGVTFRKYQEISSEEYAKYNQAATKITAAAKGFLTRRLLRTAHVQGLIVTLKDAITCATQLHMASDIGESDIDLMRRLGRQIEAAWDAVYAVFFNTDASTKMQLISADRERLRAAIKKTPVADAKKKRISSATRKSLDRKKARSLMSKSQSSSTNGCARVRVCSKMAASYPSPRFSHKFK